MAFPDLVAATDRAAQEHLGGVSVTYAPEVGDPVVVQGLFDEQYRLADDEPGSEQTVPAVMLRLSDLPVDPVDDDPTLTVEGVDYSVRERQADGMGGIRLLLRRASGGG